VDLASLDIISNANFAQNGYPHEAWARLRHEAPVLWFDQERAQPPYWAITKYHDIVEISRRPEIFRIAPRIAVFPDIPAFSEEDRPVRHLLNMDPPDHGEFRRVASPYFTPRAIRAWEPRVEQIAREVLDAAAGEGGVETGDFVARIAAPFPLYVLAELLGAPREDWPQLFQWTNETIGAADPEYRQAGESPMETATRSRMALFGYFQRKIEDCRANPGPDLVSRILAGRPYGEAIPTLELLSYYFLLVVAGNETTRNALSGGMLAFLEHPQEWERLRDGPELVDAAVEEIVRWVTPVIQFTRTATEDYELRGETIRAGQSVCLFYPSANRDEEIFDDPFQFRIDRNPNRHLGFGIGEHYCMGANLARLELRIMLRQLLGRIETIEANGKVDRLYSSFVGGIKRMPVRYRLREAA